MRLSSFEVEIPRSDKSGPSLFQATATRFRQSQEKSDGLSRRCVIKLTHKLDIIHLPVSFFFLIHLFYERGNGNCPTYVTVQSQDVSVSRL